MKLEELIRCIGINPYHPATKVMKNIIDKYFGLLSTGSAYNGGIANAYVYIPWSEEIERIAMDNGYTYPFEICNVHGGVTYGDIVNNIPSDWHCPYSKVLTREEWNKKYIVVGWDTNHYSDTWDKWTYQSVIEENELLATEILNIINKNINKI